MASYNLHAQMDWRHLFLFGVGAVAMRSAGCVINDMWDRKLDSQVERTRNRPLAAGTISMKNATIFLGFNLSLALLVLLELNFYSIILGGVSLVPVALYPAMKRITFWPQAMLGLTFNWGALLGWSAVAGSVNWPIASCLYASGFFWTLFYDTIYALQDKLDDAKAGIKSTALRFAANLKQWLLVFATASCSLFGAAGILNDQGWPYFAGLLLAFTHMVRQTSLLRPNDPKDCLKKFKSNRNVGILFLCGIMADFFLRSFVEKLVSLLLVD